jgi:protein-tyrosine phosphatase
VAELVEILSDPSNYPMLIHCQHGVTRTAKLLAMYDILYRGMSADESIARMPRFGRKDYNVGVYSFARDFEKRHAQLYPTTAGKLDSLRR